MTAARSLSPYPLFAMLDAQPRALLTREEEHLLAVRARGGDHRARGQLVERNLRLVVKIAARYVRRAPGLELQELVSEGVLGLMRAIEKFDPYSGFKLSTYATMWITLAIYRAADREGSVTMPAELRRELRALELALDEQHGRAPTTQELHEALSAELRGSVDVDSLATARSAMRCGSLDHPAKDDGSVSVGDLMPDPNGGDPADIVADRNDLAADVEAAVAPLSVEARAIVERRFGLGGSASPATLAATAHGLGMDQGDARRLERQAMRTMRTAHERRLREQGESAWP